ncbi:MAG: periplasmic heavy metal sensor [bacterium]|nr:periplasmic heavy metal sensor [bacterium]
MVKKGLYISMAVLLIAGIAGLSGCRRHSHAHKAEFMVDYISETLDLTEGQQEQLNQIQDEVMAEAREMHANKESIHAELVAQLRSEEIDQALVKARIAEHRAKMDQIIDLLVVRIAEFHKTLTPEQKDKLVAKLETFKKWHGKGWE